jgi:hypothetical protein
MKFCPFVSGETLTIIAEEANPFYLRELYLDGCDKINDVAIMNLTSKASKRVVNKLEQEQLDNGNIYLHNFSSLASNELELQQIINDISVGGAQGLEVISLSECRNLTD